MAGFTYKSYNFVDKDPIIDEVRAVVNNKGATYKWLHAESGVSTTTISKWFDGSTKRPQAASINAVLRALGYKLGIVHDREVIVTIVEEKPITQRPIIKSPPQSSMRHVVKMQKYRRK